ncbi:MAG: GAF domain-containing protein [Cyanobacteria bacterium P01_D01_bin.156]
MTPLNTNLRRFKNSARSPKKVDWLAKRLTPRGKSLRAQLLLTILPVVIGPLLIAGAVGYRVVQQRTENRLQTQLANQALLASGGTRAVVDELLALPRAIANSPLVVNEALAGGNEAEKAGLNQLPVPDLESQFADKKLVRFHRALNDYLQETVETADISEILVTNRYGFNVAYSRPTTDFVQSDEEWWQRGKEDGVWISPPDFDFASKARVVELVQSIVNPQDDEFVGVIRAVLPARKFSLVADYLKRTGISGSQRVQLIDGETLGIIDTFSPQGFRQGEKVIGGEILEEVITEISKIKSSTDNSPSSIDSYVSQITRTLEDKTQLKQLAVIPSENDTVLLSFVHGNRLYKVANVPNTRWIAVASMESREIVTAGQQLLLLFAATSLLLGGLTSGLIIFLARQLSLPLTHLSDYSKQVATGDLTVQAVPEGTKETHVLAHTFNQLVASTRSLLTAQEAETEKANLFARIASTPVTSLRGIRTIVEESLPEIQGILQVDRAFFYRLNLNGSGIVESEVLNDPYQRATNYPHREALIPPQLLVESTKVKTAVINDLMRVSDSSTAYHQCMDLLDVKSSLIVPLYVDGALYGFWVTHHCKNLHQWQPVEIAFMEQLATQFQLVFERLMSLNQARDARQVSETLSNKLKQQKLGLQKQVAELTQLLSTQPSSEPLTMLAEDVSTEHISDLFQNTFSRLLQLTANVEHINSQLKTSLTQTEEAAIQVVEPMNCQTQAALAMLETLQLATQDVPTLVETAQKALKRCRSFSGISSNLSKLHTLDSQDVLPDIENSAENPQNTEVFLDLVHREMDNISEALVKIEQQVNGGSNQIKDAQLHMEAAFKGGQQLDQLLQGMSLININQLQMTRAVDDLIQLMTLASERTSSLTEEIDSTLGQDANIGVEFR